MASQTSPEFIEGSQNKSAGQRRMIMQMNVIASYTTKEALADGFLVEVEQKISKEAGIRYPVYLSRSVWDRYVEVPAGCKGIQDQEGRLWDILYMFSWAARRSEGDTILYMLDCVVDPSSARLSNEKRNPGRTSLTITLKAVISARDLDDPSPAIFIMTPQED